jgi:hypothetical protein
MLASVELSVITALSVSGHVTVSVVPVLLALLTGEGDTVADNRLRHSGRG